MTKSTIARVAVTIAALSPSLLQAATSVSKDREARKIIRDYARCIVKSKHDLVSAMMLSDRGNRNLKRLAQSMMSTDCVSNAPDGSKFEFGGDLYRYALADALVNADFANRGDSDFSDRPPLEHLLPPAQAEIDSAIAKTKDKKEREELQKAQSIYSTMAWLSRYGECVVRHDPVKARDWLLTRPDSAEETSRINDLQLAFGECIDNGTLTFSRETLRGTVAVNYYRLAMARPQPVAEKTH